MSRSRRDLIRSMFAASAVFTADQLLGGVQFTDVAKQAGLNHKTIFGGEKRNRYLVETTGCGVAFFDYDNDGWVDLFFVNGSRFEAVTPTPTNRLFKNNRDGTFTDVTVKAGLVHSGWGQGVCAGDYDNDGHDDLFISYWGSNVLYHNNGDGTFSDVSKKARITASAPGQVRWSTGCAFLDYDRDGWLDLFVANYIDFDRKTAPVPESGTCLYKGLKVACGPPGLPGGKNLLFRNNRDGTFRDVSKEAGILETPGTYGLGVLVADFDNDGWPDIYVANDSTSSALYRNNKDGTFSEIGIEAGVAYSADGKSQAGMGVAAADFDGDGLLDIVKTNFAGDTSSLYRNSGANVFEDHTFQSGLGRNTRFLGWGAVAADFDNDGRPDILLANGHVYPEVGESELEAGYRQRKVFYRNAGGMRFEDVSMQSGAGITDLAAARGLAIGDLDNDGDLDAVINTVNGVPQLLRCDAPGTNHWLKVKCVGTKSNRSAIGARVTCITRDGRKQIDEVRSGGSYLSQSDLRIHFGLGSETSADIEVRWPNGELESFSGLKCDKIVRIEEGSGSSKS